jgi:hypothetical protein
MLDIVLDENEGLNLPIARVRPIIGRTKTLFLGKKLP